VTVVAVRALEERPRDQSDHDRRHDPSLLRAERPPQSVGAETSSSKRVSPPGHRWRAPSRAGTADPAHNDPPWDRPDPRRKVAAQAVDLDDNEFTAAVAPHAPTSSIPPTRGWITPSGPLSSTRSRWWRRAHPSAAPPPAPRTATNPQPKD